MMFDARTKYEPDTEVVDIAIPRVATEELTVQVNVLGLWHRRTPDLSHTGFRGSPSRGANAPAVWRVLHQVRSREGRQEEGIAMKKIVLAVALAFSALGYTAGVALADTGSAVVVDTGSAVTAPPDTGSAATPADQLHDPISNPTASINDIKQAKRQGWAVLAFAIGVILAKLLGRAKSLSWLAWLDKGRTAVVIGAASALVVAGYNALADGGSLYAGLYAGAVAVAAWWQSHAGENTEVQS